MYEIKMLLINNAKVILKCSLHFLTGVVAFGLSCISPSKSSNTGFELFEQFTTLALVCFFSVLIIVGISRLCEIIFFKKQKSELGDKIIICIGEASLELLQDVIPLLFIISGFYFVAVLIDNIWITRAHLASAILGIFIFRHLFKKGKGHYNQ